MKILVGYDDSKPSQKALKLAVTYARAFDANIMLVSSRVGGRETSAANIEKAEKYLEAAGSRLEAEGVPFETHLLVRGMAPGEDIVRFAEEQNAEHIIVGVKRRSNVGKMVFGSNARYVILNAPCPVVTVR